MRAEETDTKWEIFGSLEVAHDCLVSARKIAALTNHESYERIGQIIDLIEETISEDIFK